jgi:GNAT superfamily N-acetyltransferase
MGCCHSQADSDTQPLLDYRYTWVTALTSKDIEELGPLYTSAFHLPRREYRSYLRDQAGLQEWLLVYHGKQIIAFLSLHSYRDGILLANLATVARYRGRGIATEMLSQACNRILPGLRLYIQVVPEAPELLAFYTKRGFTLLPERTPVGRYQLVAI